MESKANDDYTIINKNVQVEKEKGINLEVVDADFLSKLKLKVEKTNCLDLSKIGGVDSQGATVLEFYTTVKGTYVLEQKSVKQKNGDWETIKTDKPLCNAQIFPTLFVDGEDGKYIELSIKQKTEKRVICDLSTFSNLTKKTDDLAGYAGAGGDINKILGRYIYDVVSGAVAHNLINSKTVYENSGWNDGEHVRPGDVFYHGTLPVSVISEGSFEEWRNAVNKVFHENATIHAAIPFALSVGGYLMGLDDVGIAYTPIYNMFSTGKLGSSSIGKTTLQRLILSIQQKHTKLFKPTSTSASSEYFIAANNNGFFCIDEISGLIAHERIKSGKVLADKIIGITNGGGRSKCIKGGGVTEGHVWQSVIITSANISIYDLIEDEDQATPVKARVIESDSKINALFTDKLKSGAMILTNLSLLDNSLSKNYGVAYPEIIKEIKNNEQLWTEHYNASINILVGNDDNGIIDRKAQALALAICGFRILEKIGVNIGDYEEFVKALKNIINEACAVHIKTENELDFEFRNDCLDVFNCLLNDTTIKGYIAKDEDDCDWSNCDGMTIKQKLNAKNHNSRPGHKNLATLEQKTLMRAPFEPDGFLWVDPKAAKEIKTKTGICIVELARQALELGKLEIQQCKIGSGTLFNYKSGSKKGYKFNLSDFGDHMIVED